MTAEFRDAAQTLNTSYTKKRISLSVFFILTLYPLVGMGIDLIVPSLPVISYSLGVSQILSKNLVSGYLLGGVLGNFLISFLADSISRKKLTLNILFIFSLASLLPVFFHSYGVLLFSRFLQGLAMAPFVVLARAIFTDMLSDEKLMRIAIAATVMWGLGPIIGPLIGGYLQFYFGYQACFYFFAIFGFFGFVSLFFTLPEIHSKQIPLSWSSYKSNLKIIFTNSIFIGLILLMGISFSAIIVFNIFGPFLIQMSLNHSALYYGHIALWMGASFVFGTIICKELIKKYTAERIIIATISFCTISSLLAIVFAFTGIKNIWLIVIPSALMCLCCGIVYPTAMGKSMSLFRHLAGSASSVMSFISLIIPGLIAVIVSLIDARNIISLTSIYLIISLFCGSCYFFFIRTYQGKPVSHRGQHL